MTAPDGTINKLAVYLSAPGSRHDIAVPVLCRQLGLTPTEAHHRLSTAPCCLASDLTISDARRLRDMLSVLGLPVTLRDHDGAGSLDLALQLAVWADGQSVASTLATVIDRDPTQVATAISRPGGLVMSGLEDAAARQLQAKLRPIRGLVVLTSDPVTALHDLYATRPLTLAELVRLDALRTLFGLTPDPLTEAVACGLDRRNRDAFLARAGGLDLLALDRRFQRFDLLLTGAAGWTSSELADFLVSRTQMPRAAFEQLSPDHPLPLELALRERTARQFCGDYAAIGLLVRPVLSARSGNP